VKLDHRKFLILQAIIDDYIMSAAPVGSRTISRKSGVGFSPATIRNEMSDLEELGYLAQPHTSAGRIPSPKAYRLYVDELMKAVELTQVEIERISNHLNRRTAQVEQVIRHAAQALSEITQYAAVIIPPQYHHMPIRRVQLVPVTESTALMVVVMGDGMVKDSVIRVPVGVDPDDLYQISVMLTEQLRDSSLTDARQQFAAMFSRLDEHRQLMAEVLGTLESQLEDNHGSSIVVGGSTNLLNYPEFSDVEKAKQFLSALESREKLILLLRHSGDVEFTIRIGPENEMPEFSESSVVTASYRVGMHTQGTLGIIGPTRMNYARVVSVMNYIGKLISDMLSED